MTDKNKGCLGTPVVVLKAASGYDGGATALLLLICAAILWPLFAFGEDGDMLLANVEALILVVPALFFTARTGRKVAFSNEGVTLLAGRRVLFTVPRDKLLLFACSVTKGGRVPIKCVSVSSRSIEELAALQEQRLCKNWLSRHDVPFLKRRSDWQQRFAWDYVVHLTNTRLFGSTKHGLIFLQWTPKLQQTLQSLYPNAVWLEGK